MPRNAGSKTSDNTLVLDASLGVAEAVEFCARLRILDTDQDVTLDGSRVETVDTAGLQLLTALCVQVHGNGHEVIWKSPSSVLRNYARLAGLSQELGLLAA